MISIVTANNLFNDNSDFILFYGSIDRLLWKIIEVIENYFVCENKLSILQMALIWNNLEYMKRSVVFYQSWAYKNSKSRTSFEFNYTAISQF